MLAAHLERFPARGRRLILEYGRPLLVEWKLPAGIEAEIEREDQFGLPTAMKCTTRNCGDAWAAIGSASFRNSPIHEWTVKIEDPFVSAGITACELPWIFRTNPNRQTCVEVGYEYLSATAESRLVIREYFFSGGGIRSFAPVGTPRLQKTATHIYLRNRQFRFAVDLQTNIFSVFFDHHCVQAVVPDLARYRPFCYFRCDPSRAKASFV